MKLRINLTVLLIVFAAIFIISSNLLSFLYGTKRGRKVAVDFSTSELVKDERKAKYEMLPKELSHYICDLCTELKVDSDLVVAILMVENPEFNPDATHKNENGTIDVGMFQLNDYYLWTTFKKDYWFDNIELNPFNWKHNTYIAVHHIQHLQSRFKVQDDVIMAYNGGKGAVMNGTVKPITVTYLSKVKNNLYLLKGAEND